MNNTNKTENHEDIGSHLDCVVIPPLKKGDKFSIAGVRFKKDGTVSTRCRTGNEDIFVVERIKNNIIIGVV